jgi:hypothetical protein
MSQTHNSCPVINRLIILKRVSSLNALKICAVVLMKMIIYVYADMSMGSFT